MRYLFFILILFISSCGSNEEKEIKEVAHLFVQYLNMTTYNGDSTRYVVLKHEQYATIKDGLTYANLIFQAPKDESTGTYRLNFEKFEEGWRIVTVQFKEQKDENFKKLDLNMAFGKTEFEKLIGNFRTDKIAKPTGKLSQRKQILNALREPIERELRQKVKFVVQRLNTCGDWALVMATPIQENGLKVDYRNTKYQEYIDEGMFDEGIQALIFYDKSIWKARNYTIGATDFPVDGWIESQSIQNCRGALLK